MKTSAILGFLSTITGVLAVPTEQQAPPARPRVGGPFSRDKTYGSSTVQSPWGGSVQEGQGWQTVTGTTTIPSVTGQGSAAGAAAWVGIDG